MMVGNEDLLNQLYRLSLEFGSNWRRPVEEIVQEVSPERSEAEKAELSDYIRETRGRIEQYFSERYEDTSAGKITALQTQGAIWIHQEFPWMEEANINHGISQAIYYAWHG